MDLKQLLGEELYNQVAEKAGDNKIAVVSDGSYIPKAKFDEKLDEKNTKIEKLESDLGERDNTITKLKEVAPKEETPEQREIRELREQIEEGKREATREKLMSKAVSHASEKGLPTDIVSFFIGEDEDSTMNNLSTFEEKYKAAIQSKVDEKFKASGRSVEGGTDDPQSEGAKFAQQANTQKQTEGPNPWAK